jgi:hypothetical protein
MILGSSQDTQSNWELPQEGVGWNVATLVTSDASEPELNPIPVFDKVVKRSSRLNMVIFKILKFYFN